MITNKNGRFHCIFCIFLLHLVRCMKSVAGIVKINTYLVEIYVNFAYIRTIFENIDILSIFDHLLLIFLFI